MPEPRPDPSPGPPTPPPNTGSGGTGNTPDTYDDNDKASPWDKLRNLLTRRRAAIEQNNVDAVKRLQKRIAQFLKNHPDNDRFWNEAERQGVNVDAIDTTSSGGDKDKDGDGTTPTGDGDRDKDKDKDQDKVDARRQARDNRLLDGYKLVRGPNGTYVAVYTFKIDGETVRVGVKLGKEDALAKFGEKAGNARQLNKQQMKRIKNIGNADELAPHMKRGDKHVMKSLSRYLNNQYEGQSILNDDKVMSVIIANSMFGWSPGEFENQLRNTPWWKKTEEYQRNWQTTMSPKAKKNAINSMLETVVNELEDNYGTQWIKHTGGMKQAKEWAEKIASGVWGSPDAGLEFWRNKMFDRAAKVEGTPAWIAEQQEQEQIREYNNRPEDMFEQLRSESMHYLGQIKGQPVIDRGTLMGWATDIVTERRSEGDWQKFLRQQMKRLHPYFDENVAFTEQASPYKSMYESLMGTPTDWDNKLLRQFQATDETGKPRQGDAMNLHEFELMLRDPTKNPDAYQEGTPLYDEGMSLLSGVLARMRGVS